MFKVDLNVSLLDAIRAILRPHGWQLVNPSIDHVPPVGWTSARHIEIASQWDNGMEMLKWAAENGANIAEMKVYQRAMNGE